jgi:bifunctional non-homologous end joining protein LigD/DNA ligase-1
MLAASAEPFDSGEYLYEIKWDGYRGLIYLEGGTRIYSRNLLDLTGNFPELSGLHQKVERQPVVLDGEIVVFAGGKPSFAGLQSRGRMSDAGRIGRAALERPAVFIVFDVLYAGGVPVMEQPLTERKKLLSELVTPGEELFLSEYILTDGLDFYNACVGQGLEGVVAKKLTGTYLPGRRSTYWKKFRHTREADLIICGYQPGRGGRGLGALVLGGKRGGELLYRGKVGTGFSEREAEALLEGLRKIETNEPTLAVPREERGRTRWVLPLLVCAVNFLTTTADGCLRHPVYRGMRWDKTPDDCPLVVEQ